MDDLELALPTGTLIAGDAATVFADARPCLDGLPRGSFPVRAAADGLEVLLADAAPTTWTRRLTRPTPSGYAALLDARALAEYTDLGDEPVDEFELLIEQLAAREATVLRDVLGARTGAGECVLELGLDDAGNPCRLAVRWKR
ncbi:hypothetical protein KDL01_37375 [Actinospica durhamensis]|uniref:Uncharacterized protein n=1 Tax=Actinospica durhamensis TaxID=1508375 RepID=A0A941EYT1_9ACTN|nr:hypothetical protein [Actinospica durhamensis]MBR7838998.1 hypothetical protein [Actinospica durhamensis]